MHKKSNINVEKISQKIIEIIYISNYYLIITNILLITNYQYITN